MKALGRVQTDLAAGLCSGRLDLRPSNVQGRLPLGTEPSDDRLNDETIGPLVTALTTSAFDGEIDLSENSLTEQGMLQLAEVLAPRGAEERGQASSCRCSKITLAGNPIRSRGANALAQVILRPGSNLRSVDITRTRVSDDGVGYLCQAMVSADQIEELKVGSVGHHGLEYIISALERCRSVRVVHAEVVDQPSLHKDMETLTAQDFDFTAHVAEEEPAADGDPEEEDKAAKKKAEARMERLTGNDYDSNAEEAEGAVPSKEVQPASREVKALMDRIVQLVVSTPNLVDVTLSGPSSSVVAAELAQLREERAATVQAAARDDGVGSLLAAQINELDGNAMPIRPDGNVESALPIRRGYFHRRASAAISEALFECQRFKSQQNTAVADEKGELAFVAMYLRQYLATRRSQGHPLFTDVADADVLGA